MGLGRASGPADMGGSTPGARAWAAYGGRHCRSKSWRAQTKPELGLMQARLRRTSLNAEPWDMLCV